MAEELESLPGTGSEKYSLFLKPGTLSPKEELQDLVLELTGNVTRVEFS